MKALQKWSLSLISLLGAGIFGVLSIYSVRYTMKIGYYSEGLADTSGNILCVVLLLLFVYELLHRLRENSGYLTPKRLQVLAILCAIFSVVFSICLVKDAHGVTECDQLHLSMVTEDLASGNVDGIIVGDDYFHCYPQQLGLASIYACLEIITGAHTEDIVRYFHAVCVGIMLYAGFGVVRELSDDRRAELLYLIAMTAYLPVYLYVLFVYGEALGVCCAICAIFTFLKINRDKSSGWYWGGLFVSLTLMYVARQALLVVWIAFFIIQVFESIGNRKYGRLIGILLGLIVMLTCQSLLICGANKRLHAEQMDGVPVISWIAMGMQIHENEELPPGYYNGYQVDLFRKNEYDATQTSDVSKKYIATRLKEWQSQPREFVQFYKGKILGQWNEPTYGAFIMTRLMENPEEWISECYYGDARREWSRYLDAFQAVCYLFVFLWFILIMKGEKEPKQYLLGLILMGGFFFSLIWETKSRYIYPYSVFAILCATMSMVYSYDRMRERLCRLVDKINKKSCKKEKEN